MKPKSVSRPIEATSNLPGGVREDIEDVSLEKAYELVSLLITESRLPDLTPKGRKDGCHVPSNLSIHKSCSEDNEECMKVQRYRDTIASLCRNGIPLCVEVLLCPQCELITRGQEDQMSSATSCDTMHHTLHGAGPSHSASYVLLEQWTIQQVHPRLESKLQSLQNLCNAVRSQIYFSQLSAWLQASKGTSPKHVFYRLTAPGEWFVHKFVMSPKSHTYTDAELGRGRSALRVTVSSLPRTAMTPYEISIADRDKLFGIKNVSSPVLVHSESSSLSKLSTSKSQAGLRQPGLGLSVTPNERSHTRSKSVRGLQDLPGGHNLTDKYEISKPYSAQRCLSYQDDTATLSSQPSEEDFTHCHVSAEKLASFSTVPANHLDKLELISCNIGDTPARKAPPNRLRFTSEQSMPLKSPKVLFTRTSVFSKDSFFPIPFAEDSSLNDSKIYPNDLFSDFSTDNDSDSDIPAKPKFELGCSEISPVKSAETSHRSQAYHATLTSVTKNLGDLAIKRDTHSHESNGMTRKNHSNGSATSGEQSSPGREDNSKQICTTPSTKQGSEITHPSAFPQFSRSRLFKNIPSQSSPAPVKRAGKNNFGYDDSLNSVKAIKNAISCSSLAGREDQNEEAQNQLSLSSSAPTLGSALKSQSSSVQSHSSLLGNFEESLLNGRIEPAGIVNGFTVDIGASGSFCPKHVTLPVSAYFFDNLSEDDAPSPYLGYVDLSKVSRRGYHIPRKGTLQITLFYPNHKVNKMFVVSYDLMDMPDRSQTFLRQKTVYAPSENSLNMEEGKNKKKLPTYLRYLIHLRFRSTKTGKIYLHTDIRLIYARDKFELDSRVASYELRSFIESPTNPKYSPLR